MSNSLLPWVVDRSWFVRELADGDLLLRTPGGVTIAGTFPEELVRAWEERNPDALGGGSDPATRPSEGVEWLAVAIDAALTLDAPGTEIRRLGLRPGRDGVVEWFEDREEVPEPRSPHEESEAAPDALHWTAQRPDEPDAPAP